MMLSPKNMAELITLRLKMGDDKKVVKKVKKVVKKCSQ